MARLLAATTALALTHAFDRHTSARLIRRGLARRKAAARLVATRAGPETLEKAVGTLRDADLQRGDDAAAATEEDRTTVADAVRTLAAAAPEVRLGLAAPTQPDAISALGAWVRALGLPKGPLYGCDVDGVAVEVPGPVFVKYASACGTARLRHDDDARTKQGVLFYPVQAEEDGAAQYLLPLDLFKRPALAGRDARQLRAHASRLGNACPAVAVAAAAPDGAVAALDEALEAHELVKVRTGAGKKKEARRLAEETLAPALDRADRPCYVAQVVGHTALLYRRRAGPPVVDLEALRKGDPNDLLA